MKKLIPILTFLIVLMLCTPALAKSSDVVRPSGQMNSTKDVKAIIKQLKKTGTVTLKKGGKYYLESPIKLQGSIKKNIHIKANGATIIAKKDIMTNVPKRKDYKDIDNISISGGTWKAKSNKGYKGTSFAFLHGSDIIMENMKVLHTNYDGHAFEFVGCKNVTMNNVTISPKGKSNKSFEAMVQIDIATDATAPRLKGTGLANGAICKDVTIEKSNIKGNRAVTTGWSYKDKKWNNRAHTGITIKNSDLTSYNGEGLALINVKDARVSDNAIVSNYDNTSQVKSTGLHILTMGKISNTNYIVSNNTIKGGLYSLRAYSITDVKLGMLTLTDNQFYCRKGTDNAVNAYKKSIENIVKTGNKVYKWN